MEAEEGPEIRMRGTRMEEEVRRGVKAFVQGRAEIHRGTQTRIGNSVRSEGRKRPSVACHNKS